MDTRRLIDIWDERQTHLDDEKEATIGVNWTACGPVTPDTARRFAKRILWIADLVERRRQKAKAAGYKLTNVETSTCRRKSRSPGELQKVREDLDRLSKCNQRNP